jgi:elongation factor Ts
VRIDSPEGVVGAYIHAGSQIGVLVDVQSTDSSESAKEFSRNVAMHVAATNPQVVRPEDIDQTVAAKQKEIFIGQSIEMGKPPEIAEKIVVGRMRKWQSEVSLIKQAYVKEPDMTVEKYSAQVGGVKINSFVRYQVGEGIEKVTSDLAAEVAAQLGQ